MSRVICLLLEFFNCNIDIKTKLFQAYCNNFYCSQLWSTYCKYNYNKIKAAFNNSFRRFMVYNFRCFASQMFVLNELNHFDVLRRRVMFGFANSLQVSNNSLIQVIISSVFYINSKCVQEWHNKLYVT